MKNISGTPWHIEYLRTSGHRSKRDCRYYADGNCMKLNGICQGVQFCKGIGFKDKHKKPGKNSVKKRYKTIACPYCRQILRRTRLKKHIDESCTRNPGATVRCPYCEVSVFKRWLEKHIILKHIEANGQQDSNETGKPETKTHLSAVVPCAYCGRIVMKDFLIEHMKKRCPRDNPWKHKR